MVKYRRLPLEGLFNARELGGFPTKDGGVTRYGQFIRCEIPNNITANDIDFLKAYGVTASVDLRGNKELACIPNMLSGESWLEYRNMPMFNEQVAQGAGIKKDIHLDPAKFVRWAEMYIDIIDSSSEWVLDVLDFMSAQKGVIIYNCTTGKDRTGIITAMLLGLAGVPNEDIIADYCVSEIYMRQKYVELIKTMSPYMDPLGQSRHNDLDGPFFQTSPENMRLLLEHVDSKYGGVAEYIRFCGLKKDSTETLRSRLVEK